jgi:hypothetical protein
MRKTSRHQAFVTAACLVTVLALPIRGGGPVARADGRPSPSGGDLSPHSAMRTVGDTLTVIQRPLPNIPVFVLPGGSFPVSCEAPAGVTGWDLQLILGTRRVSLGVVDAAYDASTLWWRLTASAPADLPDGLYDLSLAASGGIDDIARHAVKVLPAYRTDYTFIQITDTHLPTHRFYDSPGAEHDSASIVDLRAVIDDVNIINPEFVLLTGDLVNEGELEDYHLFRYFSKAQRLLGEFQVPIFLTSGNHDIGGWDATPPRDGTARRNWWRFFGWKRLADPPPGAPERTQDYSFDYGPVHYVGLEAYINYDHWRSQFYGEQSFTPDQMRWLDADLASASESRSQVLFYHDDFGGQLDLTALGVEMALWGHIHHDSGSLTSQPYNLATAATVDGMRAYRVVQVSDGIVTPLATVAAGANGERLRVVFSPGNDGTRDSVRAVVTNGLPIRFENACIRFLMPRWTGDIQVTGGTLLGTVDTGSALVCRVGIDLPAGATRTVDIRGSGGGPPGGIQLSQNLPNPFRRETVIGFDLPREGPVRLDLFAVDGRRVTTLLDKVMPPGSPRITWDGRDEKGRGVPSGIYYYRLETQDGTRIRSLSLIR